jgi:hypothetical protein
LLRPRWHVRLVGNDEWRILDCVIQQINVKVLADKDVQEKMTLHTR